MIRIKLKDGDTFIGVSAHDIVTQLKLDDWTPHLTTPSYKKNMRRRVARFCGEKIEYRNDLEFLQELNRIGFIETILYSTNTKEESNGNT